MRDTLARWRARSLAMSRLRARTLTKLSTTAVELVACGFRKWCEWMHAERAKEAAVVALKGVCDRRRSDRVGKLLALRVWRENAFRGYELGSSGEVDVGTGEWDSGALEALAGVAVEAAAAFSSASSVSNSARWTCLNRQGNISIPSSMLNTPDGIPNGVYSICSKPKK